MTPEDIQRMADEIVTRSARDNKKIEIEEVIAQIKAAVLEVVNKHIGMSTMLEVVSRLNTDNLTPLTYANDHAGFFVAQATEQVLRKLWLR